MFKWGGRLRKRLIFTLILIMVSTFVIQPIQSTFADELKHSEDQKHHVLLLQSYDPQNSWARDVSQGFFETIDEQRGSILVHEEFMDTKRRRSQEHYDNFTRYFEEKYDGVEFSVIVTADNNAFNYVRSLHPELFGEVPVVYVGLNKTEDNKTLPERFSGVYEEVNVDDTLKLISDIHPDESKILIITDETVTGQAVLSGVRDALKNFSGKQTVEFFMSSNLGAIDKKLNALERLDAVLILLFNADDTGKNYSYNEGLDEIYKRSPAPIYGMWKFYLSNGIVGGYLTDGFKHGEVAAENVISRLKGTASDEKLSLEVEPSLYFDYKELKRFDLESIALPNESIVINRPTEELRAVLPLLIGVSITTALVTIVIALWYMNRKEHLMNKHLESEKNRLSELIDQDLNLLVNERTEALDQSYQKCEILKNEFDILSEKNEDLKVRLNTCAQKTNASTFSSEILQSRLVEIDMVIRLYRILSKAMLKSTVHYKELLMEIGISNEKIEHIESIYEDGTMKRTDLEKYFKNRKMAINKFEERLKVVLDENQRFIDVEWTNFANVNTQHSLSKIISDAAELALIENSSRMIGVQKIIEPEMPSIKNSGYLAYVVIQLISNSIEHAFKHDETGNITILTKMDAGNCLLEIADDGIGMHENILEQACTPFFSTESDYGNFGIGLSNVKHIIQDVYQGEMEIISKVDKGTSVKITIPVLEVKRDV